MAGEGSANDVRIGGLSGREFIAAGGDEEFGGLGAHAAVGEAEVGGHERVGDAAHGEGRGGEGLRRRGRWR